MNGFTEIPGKRALPLTALCGIFFATACGDSTGPASPAYSPEEIDYFVEVALGSEYGAPKVIKKWTSDLRIDIGGDATTMDSAAIRDVVADLNRLLGDRIRLVLTQQNPNVTVWFVPVDSMPKYDPSYKPGNVGYFHIYWQNYQIYRANVLISTDAPTQSRRSHLIREELTQSLGLMNDSGRYPESIFYQPWSTVTEYAPLDRTVIRMLYRPEIMAGMTEKRVRSVLRGIDA